MGKKYIRLSFRPESQGHGAQTRGGHTRLALMQGSLLVDLVLSWIQEVGVPPTLHPGQDLCYGGGIFQGRSHVTARGYFKPGCMLL